MALHNGGVSFEANGQTYKLRYSVDAMCALEEVCGGKGIIAIATDLQDPQKVSLTLIRKVIWAGLREHHPEVEVKAAGVLIEQIGGLMKAIELIQRGLEAASPEAKKGDAAEVPPKPVHPESGIGPASSEPGSQAA
jgi:hypothetical protein